MRAVGVVAAFHILLGGLAAALIKAQRRFFLHQRALGEHAHLVAVGVGPVERRAEILLRHVEPHRQLADGVERAARDRALRHRQVDAQRLEPLRQLDQIGQFAIGARQIGLRQLMFDGAHADDAFAACGAGGHAEYPSIRDWRELWKSTCAPADWVTKASWSGWRRMASSSTGSLPAT